jgi:hypothetical protein
MSALTPVAAVQAASSLEAGTVQSAVAIKVLKTSLDQQASTAAQLIAAIPQPPKLASSGSVGTKLHAVA